MKGLAEEYEQRTIHYLFKNMRFAELAADEVVFNIGDEGDLLYIILEGQVAVMVPGDYILKGKDATPVGFLTWTLSHFKDIHWPLMPDGKRLK